MLTFESLTFKRRVFTALLWSHREITTLHLSSVSQCDRNCHLGLPVNPFKVIILNKSEANRQKCHRFVREDSQ